MYIKAVTYVTNVMNRFREDEDGIALTEYLVLLGLLVGGVIVAVTAFGSTLGLAWDGWSAWITAEIGAPAVPPE